MFESVARWAVVRLDGTSYKFSVWHDTEGAAIDEALRLTEIEGAMFGVLKYVGCAFQVKLSHWARAL